MDGQRATTPVAVYGYRQGRIHSQARLCLTQGLFTYPIVHVPPSSSPLDVLTCAKSAGQTGR